MTHKFLRLPVIKNITGLSRSTIYMRIAENRFPKPIKLGERAIAWLESDVNAWMEQQIRNSQQEVENV
ncbi:AlpA family phage regulatory protein [Candidatus Berkiella aquae]|uniref:AlpA family transcriptional regulator n=1 Tax=Candidatus Berkiella aquae TaxID=295108 RepID=A0A0Q9YLE8_9GAMM|nr:AlpA family transcriptional regulator [Candidatus Berkiella aquae]MCS5711465.1 AlpA family transcriptional regulator [Candidatus Berkiella aquae]